MSFAFARRFASVGLGVCVSTAAFAAPQVSLVTNNLGTYGRCITKPLGELNGSLFFTQFAPHSTWATTKELNDELWKTDGTAAGTTRVAALGTPTATDVVLFGSGATYGKGAVMTLYQRSVDILSGKSATLQWLSDGTAGGTISSTINFSNIFRLSGQGFFVSGLALQRTDGTIAGTKTAVTFPSDTMYVTVVARDQTRAIVITENGSGRLRFVWVTDGTQAGTRLLNSVGLSTIDAPAAGSIDGDDFYFSSQVYAAPPKQAFDKVSKVKLSASSWAPTVMWSPSLTSPIVVNAARAGNVLASVSTASETTYYFLNGTSATPLAINVKSVRQFGGRFLMVEGDYTKPKFPYALYASDLTAAGTTKLIEGTRVITFAASDEGATYFSHNDGTNGTELWATDGTADGTLMVKDFDANPNATGFDSAYATGSGGYVGKLNGAHYVVAADGTTCGLHKIINAITTTPDAGPDAGLDASSNADASVVADPSIQDGAVANGDFTAPATQDAGCSHTKKSTPRSTAPIAVASALGLLIVAARRRRAS